MAQAQHRPEKKAASELGNRGMLKEFKDFIAKGNVMDLSLIHISEPTRPY